MPQLLLNIDQETLDRIVKRAESENISVSELVVSSLARYLTDTWDPSLLATFGSIQDPTFVVPDEIDPSLDIPREEL